MGSLEYETQAAVSQRNSHILYGLLGLSILLAISVAFFLNPNDPPRDFPSGEAVKIPEGASIQSIATKLSSEDVVRSELFLQFVLRTTHDNAFIQAGLYRFPEPLTTKEVADAITDGTFATPLDTNIVTFPEGFRVTNMHEYLPERFGEVSLEQYIEHEGYLFPDTYYIQKTDTLDDVIELMRTNFDTRIEPLRPDIERTLYSLEEVIILASILEREGNTERSMRIIAGILEERLNAGVPLQVDAAFEYVLGKTSAELTEEDLAIDSPFNTYTNTGLPPHPISNPGLVAIRAVIDPIETEYFYYLSDSDGNFHYAETFEEHKANKRAYLQ